MTTEQESARRGKEKVTGRDCFLLSFPRSIASSLGRRRTGEKNYSRLFPKGIMSNALINEYKEPSLLIHG